MSTRTRTTRTTVTPRIVAKANFYRVTIECPTPVNSIVGVKVLPLVTYPVRANTKAAAFTKASDAYRRKFYLPAGTALKLVGITVDKPTLAF